MGKMVADAYRYSASKVVRNLDFAMVNGGGVRSEMQAGDVSVNDVYELLPFSNEIYVVEILGKDIIPLINGAINGHGGLPTFVGIDVVYVKTKKGFKVHSARIVKNGKSKPLIADKKYTLATLSFLYKGGDGYNFSRTKLINKSGIMDNEAFYNYILEKYPKK